MKEISEAYDEAVYYAELGSPTKGKGKIDELVQAIRADERAKWKDFDPQAVKIGWFIDQGWLPPSEAQMLRAKILREVGDKMSRDIYPHWNFYKVVQRFVKQYIEALKKGELK